MRTLKRFNSDIEVYSIDEAFMDLSNYTDTEVESVGREIRQTVLKWTGIPTSIGIAKTKTLSKVANHIAKKKQSGVTSLIGIENLDPMKHKRWGSRWASLTSKQKILLLKIKLKFFHQIILYMETYLEE